ncbi:PEP-CTERM sorting domain-containing protein [Pontiella agarivorans]|nr:PEP-CTERM sorting domain-containing protein [Pontiella agarivorans]
MTTGTASHQFEIGKQASTGNALFMFEFRDPSEVLADTGFSPVQVSIPEPSSITLSALTLIAAFGLRRIFQI